MSPHPQGAGQGGVESRRAPARQRTCSGQTGGGARPGEAEIRASIRELRRRRTAGNGRRGLPAGRGGVMPTQPHYVPLPPAPPPQASPPPPWGQVSTHLSTQHLQGQGWGSWAGALGGLPEIGVPLRASPLESFHLQEPTSVQGWERGLCSRWVSTLSRWDAGKAVLGEGLCPSVCAGVSRGSMVQSAGRGWGGRVTSSRSVAALHPRARRRGVECRRISDDVALVPAAP